MDCASESIVEKHRRQRRELVRLQREELDNVDADFVAAGADDAEDEDFSDESPDDEDTPDGSADDDDDDVDSDGRASDDALADSGDEDFLADEDDAEEQEDWPLRTAITAKHACRTCLNDTNVAVSFIAGDDICPKHIWSLMGSCRAEHECSVGLGGRSLLVPCPVSPVCRQCSEGAHTDPDAGDVQALREFLDHTLCKCEECSDWADRDTRELA